MRDTQFNPATRPAEICRREIPVKNRRRIASALFCAVLGAALPGRAQAHAVVVRSSPAAGAVVAAGPLEITLVFNTRLDRVRSRLVLSAPDRTVTPIALRAEAAPTRLSGTANLAMSGRWTIRWQVLAADGHVTRGEIPFGVSASAQR
jgi:methionine-rich copper-binding protein CopC